MRLLFLTATLALAQNATYPVKPVPFTAVHFHDDFWAPRIELNRKATIPAALGESGFADRKLLAPPSAHRTSPPVLVREEADNCRFADGRWRGG